MAIVELIATSVGNLWHEYDEPGTIATVTTTPSWMIDELAYAGPEHRDPDFVAGYDRKQGYPDPGPDIATLRAHGLGVESTVVDLGAGTGQFALPAAEVFGQVVAVDVASTMLDRLREQAEQRGLSNLTCIHAGLLDYAPSGPPVDAVFTRHVLHHLPDFFKVLALQRIADMLRPGGIMVVQDLIYDFGPDQAEQVFAEWFAAASSDPTVGYTAEDYAEHIRTEYSTFRWLFEPMLDAAGFDILTVEYHLRAFGHYVCRKRSSPEGRPR